MRTVNGSEGNAVSPSGEKGFIGLGEGVHFALTSGRGAFSRGVTVLLGKSRGRLANVLLADDIEGVMGGKSVFPIPLLTSFPNKGFGLRAGVELRVGNEGVEGV
jgi:hypothetical protein